LLKAREDAAARKILERILKMPSASAEQRQGALASLRNDYERAGDKGRFVEALESAHELPRAMKSCDCSAKPQNEW
jgi:hypothetical protein